MALTQSDADSVPVDEQDLSEHSRHALALAKLQGYVPTQEVLDRLADLDAGRLTHDQYRAILDAKPKRA